MWANKTQAKSIEQNHIENKIKIVLKRRAYVRHAEPGNIVNMSNTDVATLNFHGSITQRGTQTCVSV